MHAHPVWEDRKRIEKVRCWSLADESFTSSNKIEFIYTCVSKKSILKN